MPFRSKKQMKACFASNGFNGKVNCDEWAKATSNIDSLPDKAMDGGCMECGGKMQQGGVMPHQQDYPDYESWQQAMDDWMAQNNPQQAIPGITIGRMMEDTNPPPPDSQQLAAAPVNPTQDAINRGITRDPQYYHNGPGMTTQNITKKGNNPYQTLQNVGLGLKAFRTGLGEIAGRVERGRQNQYDYMQQSALGQMNPIPTNDFQPNPYNLYMQQGGNLNMIMKNYNQYSNNAQMDFGSGDNDNGMMSLPEMKKGGYEIDRMLVVRKLLPQLLKFGTLGTSKYRNYKKGGLSRSSDYGSAGHPYPSVDASDFAGPGRSYPIPTRADAIDALRLAHLHGADDVIAHIHAKYPDLAYGGHPYYQQGGIPADIKGRVPLVPNAGPTYNYTNVDHPYSGTYSHYYNDALKNGIDSYGLNYNLLNSSEPKYSPDVQKFYRDRYFMQNNAGNDATRDLNYFGPNAALPPIKLILPPDTQRPRKQVGGQYRDPLYEANATLAYYKDTLNNKLKEKNPQGFQDYFKGLVDYRRKGDQTGAQSYVQNSQYNDYLTPDEVRSTLGTTDYDKYLNSLKTVNSYNVQQGMQPLYGNIEGEQDVNNLNYGRRFASLQVNPSINITNATTGNTYGRNYVYNPSTGSVDFTESGDVGLRPSYLKAPQASSIAKAYKYGGSLPRAKRGWIQKAINPAHKGYCTPMSKSTCTPRRKALARRFKSGDLS